MIPSHTIARLCTAGALVLAGASAQAGPVTLSLQGHITGHEFIDLGPLGLTVGSSVNLSLSFNETFSDGTYSFSDPLGPVSGTMSVGALSFSFDDAEAYSYSYNSITGAVNWVQPQFTGTGPTLGGGDFYGLFAVMTPSLTLQGPLYLGYGFTTVYPEGTSITSFGYALITPDSYSITPVDVGTVPVPATLPLVATALLGAGWGRRRGAARLARARPRHRVGQGESLECSAFPLLRPACRPVRSASVVHVSTISRTSISTSAPAS